jgi:restriction endonuclease Mrr
MDKKESKRRAKQIQGRGDGGVDLGKKRDWNGAENAWRGKKNRGKLGESGA